MRIASRNSVTACLSCDVTGGSSDYDQAARQALFVLWEAFDRVCGKRVKPLLRTLIPAMERPGHVRFEPEIRDKLTQMGAATIDCLLRERRKRTKKH